MDYTKAAEIVDSVYGCDSRYTEMLSKRAIVVLARLYQETKKKRNMTPETLQQISTMDEQKQCDWLSEPFLEWIRQRVEASCFANSVSSCEPIQQQETVKVQDKKLEVKAPEPEEEDDMGINLFD